MAEVAALHAVRYAATGGSRSVLVAGEPGLASALAAELPGGEVALPPPMANPLPPEARRPRRPGGEAVVVDPAATRELVATRDALALAGEDWLAAARLVLAFDASEADRRLALHTMAAHREARFLTLASLDTIAAAEHTILLLLALARRLLPAYSELVAGTRRPGVGSRLTGSEPGTRNWPGLPEPATLYGRTLGVVGLGRVGAAVAERARALGMRVLYHDPEPRAALAARLGLEGGERDFPDLLRQADFVSLHLPLTPATLRLIDAPELALMRPEAVLLNTAHGRLIDEGALISALHQGAIAGAGLDVFAYEALPATSPLLALDTVVLTPHIAGVDPTTNLKDMARRAAATLLHGDSPL
ncbi:MAG TPA: NAD(P)-dependent oxidoreductase [Thermomicrobiaceae bacterium]|nr:NAD(P)-dependent oxidoreductase [Thermomicrobiaceae bacterium]